MECLRRNICFNIKNMRILDTIKISARSFKNNRLRTFLTIMGISVGIASIFFLVSLGYGMQKVVLEKIATSDSLLSLDVFSGNTDEGVIMEKEMPAIKNIHGIVNATPVITQKVQIHNDNFTTDTKINIVNSNFFRMEGVNVQYGKLFSVKDVNTAIVTKNLLDLLHINVNNFQDKKIIIDIAIPSENKKDGAPKKTFSKEYLIKGVIKNENKANVYIPISSVAGMGFDYYNRVKIKVTSNNQIDPVRKALAEKGYLVSAISDTVDQTRKIFSVIQIVLLSFGMLALIVSAIGMFNTMTISLLERTQEIAIMKSLGASAKDIWSMFLTESILIGFLGGTLGVLTGYLGTKFFNFILNLIAVNFGGAKIDLFYIPLLFVVFVIVFSTLVGLITGFYPAKRAAALDTLKALRYK